MLKLALLYAGTDNESVFNFKIATVKGLMRFVIKSQDYMNTFLLFFP